MMFITLLLVALAMANKDESASGMLARLEERRNVPVGVRVLRTSSSSSSSSADSASSQNNDPNDDDDFSTSYSDTTTSSTTERIAQRIARNQLEEENRIEAIEAEFKKKHRTTVGGVEVKSHLPYQAVFTRLTGPGEANACAEQTVSAQNNISSCVLLEIGPVVIIGKTSAPSVRADVFDGDLDGKLDVDEAFRQLSLVNGSTTLVSFDAVRLESVNRLSDFLFEIRNRAVVNGGTIDLTSLVLTGRVGNGENPLPFPDPLNANAAPAFQTFGRGKTLISPCISVPLDDDFNLELFGVIKAFNGLVTGTVGGFNFFKNGDAAEGFADPETPIGPFTLFPTNTTQLPTAGLVGAPFLVAIGQPLATPVGNVKFERCQQFSYFN